MAYLAGTTIIHRELPGLKTRKPFGDRDARLEAIVEVNPSR